MKKKIKVIVILGPTASGKSKLAVSLAKKYKGEIISADSRQVYRGLDIGTGKITKREMGGIPHHLLDVSSPLRTYTAARFLRDGKKSLRDISRRKKNPFLCGGTGFYIDALLYGIHFPTVPPQPKLRKELARLDTETLFARLRKLDPVRAGKIDSQNPHRLIRALEIILTTKNPVPPLHEKVSDYEILKIGISVDLGALREKIHARLRKRIRQGLIREVENLHKEGVSYKRFEELGLEYRFVAKFLKQEISKKEMVAMLEKEIYQYAKRQMTWFKRDQEIHWIKNEIEAKELVQSFLKE